MTTRFEETLALVEKELCTFYKTLLEETCRCLAKRGQEKPSIQPEVLTREAERLLVCLQTQPPPSFRAAFELLDAFCKSLEEMRYRGAYEVWLAMVEIAQSPRLPFSLPEWAARRLQKFEFRFLDPNHQETSRLQTYLQDQFYRLVIRSFLLPDRRLFDALDREGLSYIDLLVQLHQRRLPSFPSLPALPSEPRQGWWTLRRRLEAAFFRGEESSNRAAAQETLGEAWKGIAAAFPHQRTALASLYGSFGWKAYLAVIVRREMARITAAEKQRIEFSEAVASEALVGRRRATDEETEARDYEPPSPRKQWFAMLFELVSLSVFRPWMESALQSRSRGRSIHAGVWLRRASVFRHKVLSRPLPRGIKNYDISRDTDALGLLAFFQIAGDEGFQRHLEGQDGSPEDKARCRALAALLQNYNPGSDQTIAARLRLSPGELSRAWKMLQAIFEDLVTEFFKKNEIKR